MTALLPSEAERALDALAERFGLSPAVRGRLALMTAVVSQDRTAPTTDRDAVAVVDRHLADSLVAVEAGLVPEVARLADLGSGAGFPGLALAAVLPGLDVRLVESVGRKCAFVERVIVTAGIGNAAAVHARAESWAAGIGWCDVVTARALAPLGVLLEYAAPLLVDGGRLVAWKGEVDAQEAADAAAASETVGLESVGVTPVSPFAGSERRTLHVYSKVRPTPSRFPRREGMARKRPLSA